MRFRSIFADYVDRNLGASIVRVSATIGRRFEGAFDCYTFDGRFAGGGNLFDFDPF